MSVEQNNQSSIISFCFNLVIIEQTTSVDAHKVKRPFLPVALYAKNVQLIIIVRGNIFCPFFINSKMKTSLHVIRFHVLS